MIAAKKDNNHNGSSWQIQFATMFPEIEQHLRRAFRQLDPASKDEAIGEGVLHALRAYSRLYERGREQVATPASLAFYSVRAVRRGRPAAGKMNGQDVLSRYAQVGHGIQVDRSKGEWIEALVEDKRASVPDQVATKLDFGSWFSSLTMRMKEIAMDLAFGFSTSEVAQKHGVTSGRISQLRRMLEESWAAFQHEGASVLS